MWHAPGDVTLNGLSPVIAMFVAPAGAPAPLLGVSDAAPADEEPAAAGDPPPAAEVGAAGWPPQAVRRARRAARRMAPRVVVMSFSPSGCRSRPLHRAAMGEPY